MNDKELFDNKCLPLFWLEDEEHFANNVELVVPKKSLETLTAELEDIKNTIDELRAKEWHLDRLLLKYQN